MRNLWNLKNSLCKGDRLRNKERVNFSELSAGFLHPTVKIPEQSSKTQITRQIIIMITNK